MAVALRANQQAFESGGGQFEYTDPLEIVRDLVVLRRVIPSVTILAADNPNLSQLGYLGYWHWYDPGSLVVTPTVGLISRPSEEVSTTLVLPMETLALWEGGARANQVEVVRHFFTTADGRQRLLRFVEEMATAMPDLDGEGRDLFRAARPSPEPQNEQMSDSEPEPEPEVYIPTRWERLLRDDEPL